MVLLAESACENPFGPETVTDAEAPLGTPLTFTDSDVVQLVYVTERDAVAPAATLTVCEALPGVKLLVPLVVGGADTV